MPVATLILFGVYLAVAFGLRSWLQLRRTGDSGFRGISGRPGSAEWWAGVGFVAALVAGVLGPVMALLGLDPVPVLSSAWVQLGGSVLAIAGVAATFVTQLQMGANWRIGVDVEERH